MSRASTLARAIGSDGTLNVADVGGLHAIASSGSASDLSTGTVPVARLGSGTKDSTTFLRGDNSFQTVSVTPTAVSDQSNTSTGYFDLPAGTTAQRPGSPHSGMQRWNTDLGAMEYYNGTAWSTNFQQTYPIDFLVIAGGGGGGHRYSGGGAGGYRTSAGTSGGGAAAESAVTVTAGGSYAITIGAGGAGGTTAITPPVYGNSSSLGLLITSVGGGRGGVTIPTDGKEGKAGGSGGGATGDGDTGGTSISGGAGTTGQGYAGGAGWDQSGNNSGGGGGGAGQVGGSATSPSSTMAGGNGVSSSITGTAVTRGGGGAPARQTPSDPGTAGTGGGGTAGGGNGSANTGGGGGCGRDSTGGSGGSGVVIIRYASTTQRGTGGTVTTYTSGSQYWVHTFTSSGTYTA